MPLSSVVGAQSIIKPGVCTSTTRPASPYDGQVIYETDTDKTLVYNGTGWVFLSTSRANPVGLDLVKTQTVGTAVSSVTVSDAFSSSYDSYKIIATGVAATGNGNVTFQLSGLTTAYYGNLVYANWVSATPQSAGYSNIASITHGAGVDLTSLHLDIDIDGPFLARPTFIICKYIDGASSGVATVKQTSSTSTTGFTITAPSTSTFTGGTIRVYGYTNS
jgi:hypothetical protein